MNILWFSNISILKWNANKSGTWIFSMYEQLKQSPDVKIIGNITTGNKSDVLCSTKTDSLEEFYIPNTWINKDGSPKVKAVKAIGDIINSLHPDIIHIWGIELCWADICQQLTDIPQLIEIQGFKGVYSNELYFGGGISNVQSKTRGFVEWLFPKQSYKNMLSDFRHWGRIENNVLENAKHINTQSEWVRSIIKSNNQITASIYNTDIILRDSFLKCDTWDQAHKIMSDHPIIFCLSAGRIYKGIHVVIEAFSIVASKYPNAELRIAGVAKASRKLLNSGYIKYLLKLITKLGLNNKVRFLGNIGATQIIEELHKCDVCVNASFVETYCLSLAESLAVGVPCVASYTAALPELITDGINGELFPMGDKYACAAKILKLIEDKEYCIRISKQASARQRERNAPRRIRDIQVEIYRTILSSQKKN